MRRKIDDYLQTWRHQPNHKPLIIGGARQVGKTYSVREFGNTYASFVEINFVTHPEYKLVFQDGFEVNSILNNISFRSPSTRFIEGDTLIFFDEMQEYPDCATSLKFFKEDGRFDVICSGSLMGIHYKDITSNSVGYKTDITMYAFDFEEFLWAKGYSDTQVDSLLEHLLNVIPFNELEMSVMTKLFLEYAVVGGMPEIVSNYIQSNLFHDTLPLQKQLLTDYEEDIVKYAKGLDKAKIKNVYRNIPIFLAKENKKFQITKISTNARNREYAGCVEWLADSGMVHLCHNLQFPELPLKGNYIPNQYKIYYHDNSLLLAAMDEESGNDLRRNQNLGVFKGAVYENLVAEALFKMGYPLYYYKKENAQLEMDFFIRDTDSLVPVEVKAKNGATKSLNALIENDKYADIRYGIKLCAQNIGFNGKFYTIPYFCTFLLKRWLTARERKGA